MDNTSLDDSSKSGNPRRCHVLIAMTLRLVVLILVGLALCSCGGSGSGSGPSTQVLPIVGKKVSEQHIGGAALHLGDSVLDSLEGMGAGGGVGDTGTSGSDTWMVDVSEARRVALGIDGVAGVRLSMLDPDGVQVASIQSNDPVSSVNLRPGRYRLVVENLAATSQVLWVGWLEPKDSRSISYNHPGIYVYPIEQPSPIVGTPTSNAAFIGMAGAPLLHPTPVFSIADFQAYFPSAPDGPLKTEVEQFFLSGGTMAYVTSTADASQASLQAGLDSLDDLLGFTCQVLLAPDMTTLDLTDWGVAAKLLMQGVDKRAMVILEPPAGNRTLADVPAYRAALAGVQNTEHAAMYFPWFVDPQGHPIPPGGTVAGLWSAQDISIGVWAAPAGTELNVPNGLTPEVIMTDSDQAGLNVSPSDGLSINGIREFPVYGTKVWGARTLDGNSDDYRYISTVRTLVYIEQSIKLALQPYVFAQNDAATWQSVKSAISSFLTDFWQQGGLYGSNASDAFSVQCGLGSTMTAQDILNGYMIVQVSLSLIHPAEFIVLTFTQTMGS